MTDCPDFIGSTIDGKYQMTRELGRGGMGTVYLATHLGTERPVAVKIIAPQFMRRAEFVERFRREARAAGRLRHPNVVDVTDFGFADTDKGQVAYLVMEYLDGCTLGEVLDEEKNLPVSWTLDILDQICSAVHEAHEQGIIHRDLKPDNIWLEPNQRGGYTVKVLDFGIAKLEEHDADNRNGETRPNRPASLTEAGSNAIDTVAADEIDLTNADFRSSTMVGEGSTVLITPTDNGENETAIFTPIRDIDSDQDIVGTQLIETGSDLSSAHISGRSIARTSLRQSSSAELTRVGAVLGTPLYMSPEQCRGEHLEARSDIYSIGVIAYQMLSGRTPFEGDYKDVMEAHKSAEPEPLNAKGVRKKMRLAIHSALAKDPIDRPATAEAFASVLRSRSEGIFAILRRSLVIYSEHLPKFLALTAFFSVPTIVLTVLLLVCSFLKNTNTISETAATALLGVLGTLLTLVSSFVSYLNIGTITWIVVQYLAVPLRPVRLRPALAETQKLWRTFAGTGVLTTVTTFALGVITCGIGFLVFTVAWSLVAPVVMMERLSGRAAMKRSYELVKRSVMTSTAAILILFLLPAMIAGTISFVVNVTARAFDPVTRDQPIVSVVETGNNGDDNEQPPAVANQKSDGFEIKFGTNPQSRLYSISSEMRTNVKRTVLESLIQLLWLPVQIVVLSFCAIIVALLYVKTRLAGGESMETLIERFEDDERPRKKWQERVRARLLQSGRLSSRS